MSDEVKRVRAYTERFLTQRRIVVQLLKDWADPYAASDEPGWSLNREVTSRWSQNEVAVSHRILDAALKSMSKASPFYPALQAVLLHAEAGHSDLDHLAQKARRYGPTSDSAILYERVTDSIDVLTQYLIDAELYCTFPEREVKTTRRQLAEDRYLEVAASFDLHLEEASKTHRRAVGKAYDLTADQYDVSRNTVERAVKWRNEHENHGQKHRTKKIKGRMRHGAATTEYSYTDARSIA